MASQFHFISDAREDLLIVTEERSQFFAMYEKQTDRPELVLVRRSPSVDQVLIAAAFQAAVSKARELGGSYDDKKPGRGAATGSLSAWS